MKLNKYGPVRFGKKGSYQYIFNVNVETKLRMKLQTDLFHIFKRILQLPHV